MSTGPEIVYVVNFDSANYEPEFLEIEVKIRTDHAVKGLCKDDDGKYTFPVTFHPDFVYRSKLAALEGKQKYFWSMYESESGPRSNLARALKLRSVIENFEG